MLLGLITLFPVIALFYDGYKRDGLKGGFLNLGYFTIIVLIAIFSIKVFGIYFALVIPVLFLIMLIFKFLTNSKK
jgi:hypothetical protein